MSRAASAGDVVADKYRIERLLGSGGMGYVVAARHLSLDQLVAIKFLGKDGLRDDDALARFRREAKAASRLRSDHVAKVFDVGVHDNDEPFIVMEYLDGADLGAVAKQRGKLAVSEACEYVLQACEALAEAHSLGIVHRDVKLANLFLTRSASGWPVIKVLDFGVSKTTASAEAQADVTRTAAMLGSPKYMSPEQMNDPRAVDARSDIWSLGICLYRLVTGTAPFEGETIGRLCTLVLHHQPPPVQASCPDAPPAFGAVVARCLEKDRTRRFANVAELAAAIAPFCIDAERAQSAIVRMASVLGVPAPPMGWMPPASPEGVAARAPTRRPEVVLAVTMAAMTIVLATVGFVWLRTSSRAAAAAAAAPTTTAAPEPTVSVTAPAVATVETTTSAVTATVAPAPPPSTASTSTTASPRRASTKPSAPSRPRGEPKAGGEAQSDPFSIPSDRK